MELDRFETIYQALQKIGRAITTSLEAKKFLEEHDLVEPHVAHNIEGYVMMLHRIGVRISSADVTLPRVWTSAEDKEE